MDVHRLLENGPGRSATGGGVETALRVSVIVPSTGQWAMSVTQLQVEALEMRVRPSVDPVPPRLRRTRSESPLSEAPQCWHPVHIRLCQADSDSEFCHRDGDLHAIKSIATASTARGPLCHHDYGQTFKVGCCSGRHWQCQRPHVRRPPGPPGPAP